MQTTTPKSATKKLIFYNYKPQKPLYSRLKPPLPRVTKKLIQLKYYFVSKEILYLNIEYLISDTTTKTLLTTTLLLSLPL